MIFCFLFFLLLEVPVVFTCYSSGVCGGSCYQPPPTTCVQASCQAGYTCGQYGCAKIRAHSALTKKDGLLVTDEGFSNSSLPKNNIFGVAREAVAPRKVNETMFLKLTNPNYLFRQCCEDRNLPDVCLTKCHFNSYTSNSLQEMFFKNDPCPIQAAADIQYCAGQGRDHRSCCARNGVHMTLAGDKCMIFCDQRPGKITQLSWDYVPCYEKFENIKRCFYDDIRALALRKYSPLLEKPNSNTNVRK